MSSAMVRISVVGHANTGKTSLIRTLLRDTQFGEVADYAGTTRHVEAAQLSIDGELLIELFDTPGLEDSVALKQLWQKQAERTSVSEKMSGFIELLESKSEFAQEQKVLRQALKSDVLLYVIDAREPYLGKYHDEIDLLRATAKPIVPVLNFVTADPQNKQNWRDKLIDHGLHAVVEYDTVAFTMESERRLFEKLQSLAEPHYATFQKVIAYNRSQYQHRCEAAAKAIAEQYINVAAYRIRVDEDTFAQHTPQVQDLVRQAEQKAVDQLLDVFGFSKDDVRNDFLPVENGRWTLDLFDAQTYKDFGVQAGTGAAKGAAVGAGVDLFVGGVSLGVGAAIGAVAGVIWNSLQKYGGSLRNKLTGAAYLCVDDATLELFYRRQRYLLHSMMTRGHAAQDVVALGTDSTIPETTQALNTVTHKLRDHNHWSYLDNPRSAYLASAESGRVECCESLIKILLAEQ